MRWWPAWLAVGLILLLPVARPQPGTRFAQFAATNPPAIADSSAVADSLAPADSLALADSLARVPPPPPPRDYLAEVRANFTEENRAYAGTRVVLAFIEPIYVIMVMLVLLFAGVAARLRDIARNLGHRRYVLVLV